MEMGLVSRYYTCASSAFSRVELSLYFVWGMALDMHEWEGRRPLWESSLPFDPHVSPRGLLSGSQAWQLVFLLAEPHHLSTL